MLTRLLAEAFAFPFSSAKAFELSLVKVPREGVSPSPLAQAFDEHMRLRSRGASLSQLAGLRDEVWFGGGRDNASLVALLERLASQLLSSNGAGVALKSGPSEQLSPAVQAERWRWVSLMIPADLLIGALAGLEGREPQAVDVGVVTPQLASVLAAGVAETHLHVGAGIPFSMLWTGLCVSLHEMPPSAMKNLACDRGAAPPFGGGERMVRYLLAALVCRLVLAAFLRSGESGGFAAGLDRRFELIAQRLCWPGGEAEAKRLLWGCCEALMRPPSEPPERAKLVRLTRRLRGPVRGTAHPNSFGELSRLDPMAAWLPPRAEAVPPESRFLHQALCYLKASDDVAFARLFWQYQRIRCMTYRALCEEPGTPGLDWFTQQFYRISPLRGKLDACKYRSALEIESRDLHLASLEARTAPGARWVDIRDEVRALARQAAAFCPPARRERPEVGLVLHFVKSRERKGPRASAHADPAMPPGARHGAWYRDQQSRAFAIKRALKFDPTLLAVLRGIDVANIETAQPMWVVAPLLKDCRQASKEAASRLAHRCPSWQVSPLRVTCHVGEEWVRLVEGVRHVHEALASGALSLGDRVGHGLAVGQDPSTGASGEGLQPLEDRLDDLLWELDRYAEGDLSPEPGRVRVIEEEAERLAEALYDSSRPSLREIRKARQLLLQGDLLKRWRYPGLVGVTPCGAVEGAAWRLLTDPALYQRGRRQVRVAPSAAEVAMLGRAQRWLRELLGKLEVVFEANPTSNLLIADMSTLSSHPVFGLAPIIAGAERSPPVQVSLNTDNPLTFASSLADEYAHIYHALLRLGLPGPDALLWMDQRRRDGMSSRFTLEITKSHDALTAIGGVDRHRRRHRGGAGLKHLG